MRFATDFLALFLFSLFVGALHFAAWGGHLLQTRTEQLINSNASPDTDSVEAQLKKELGDQDLSRTNAPAEHERSDANLESLLSTPLLFASNSAKLTVGYKKFLERAAAWLGRHPDSRIFIVGYCDKSGSEGCTPTLAENRAEMVQQFLLEHGTSANQIAGVKG